ncbi:PPC domain-containing protein [Myxococcus sp. 1LA]
MAPGAIFTVAVPEGTPFLKVFVSAGSVLGSLFVREGAVPTSTEFDCRAYGVGSDRTCVIRNPAPGTWYLQLTGRVVNASLTALIPKVPEQE